MALTAILTGQLDGALYEVQVTGDVAQPVVGNRRITALVQQHAGRPVLLTPTGPSVPVAGDDPMSVVALLEQKTKVLTTDFDGGRPKPPGGSRTPSAIH